MNQNLRSRMGSETTMKLAMEATVRAECSMQKAALQLRSNYMEVLVLILDRHLTTRSDCVEVLVLVLD